MLYAKIIIDDTNNHITKIYTNEVKLKIDGILENKAEITRFIHETTLKNPIAEQIIKKSNSTNMFIKNKTRIELESFYMFRFKKMKSFGIEQLHFYLPNNESFLRLHMPDNYGDNLSYRNGIKFTNLYKSSFIGYEHGVYSSGYRYIYPLIYSGKHYGSMELTINENVIKDYFKRTDGMGIDIIFRESSIQKSRKELFRQFGLLDGFYERIPLVKETTRTDKHKTQILQSIKKNDKFRNNLDRGIDYHSSMIIDGIIHITTFTPLRDNISRNTIGYIITYEESNELGKINDNILIFKIIFIILILTSTLGFLIMSNKNKKLEYDIINTDMLTGLQTRKHFTSILYDMVKINSKITFVYVHIDDFTDINTHGYIVGDNVLKNVSTIIKGKIGKEHLICRWSGIDYAFIVEDIGDNAFNIIEDIRITIEEYIDTRYGNVTCSIGATPINKHTNLKECIDVAFNNLREAKRLGKNRTVYR
jgi:diguanylate cyclase (GGDEF)-like protein